MRIMIYSGNKNNNISEAGVTTSLLFIHKISSKGSVFNYPILGWSGQILRTDKFDMAMFTLAVVMLLATTKVAQCVG